MLEQHVLMHQQKLYEHFFLGLTRPGNETYAADVNSFIRAVAEVSGGFSSTAIPNPAVDKRSDALWILKLFLETPDAPL